MTYKEELRGLLSEGHKLADAHRILKARRSETPESEKTATEEVEVIEAKVVQPSELKAGDKLPCPNCGNPVGITIRYLNNKGKRGLHCYQCNLTFNP